jgi:ParB family chromosome partitioning protein
MAESANQNAEPIEVLMTNLGIQEIPGGWEAPLDKVEVEKGFNIRKEANTKPPVALVESIKQHGVIEPITARITDDGRLLLINGERRYRASKQLNLPSIPVSLRDEDDTGALVISMTSRHGLPFTDDEYAAGLKRLKDGGLTVQEIAGRLSISQRVVVELLRIVEKASPAIKKDATIPTRVKARASQLPKKAQDAIAPKLKGKSRSEGQKLVRDAEKKAGKTPRGRKPQNTNKAGIRKDLSAEIVKLEKAVKRGRKAEPRSQRFKVLEDVVTWLRDPAISIRQLVNNDMPARK